MPILAHTSSMPSVCRSAPIATCCVQATVSVSVVHNVTHFKEPLFKVTNHHALLSFPPHLGEIRRRNKISFNSVSRSKELPTSESCCHVHHIHVGKVVGNTTKRTERPRPSVLNNTTVHVTRAGECKHSKKIRTPWKTQLEPTRSKTVATSHKPDAQTNTLSLFISLSLFSRVSPSFHLSHLRCLSLPSVISDVSLSFSLSSLSHLISDVPRSPPSLLNDDGNV